MLGHYFFILFSRKALYLVVIYSSTVVNFAFVNLVAIQLLAASF